MLFALVVMFAHFLDAHQFADPVFVDLIDGTIGPTEADRPLTTALAGERLVVIPGNLPSLFETLGFYHLDPGLELDDDVLRHPSKLLPRISCQDNPFDHASIVHQRGEHAKAESAEHQVSWSGRGDSPEAQGGSRTAAITGRRLEECVPGYEVSYIFRGRGFQAMRCSRTEFIGEVNQRNLGSGGSDRGLPTGGPRIAAQGGLEQGNGTKGSPGGKVPSGKLTVRSPVFRRSAASRYAATIQA